LAGEIPTVGGSTPVPGDIDMPPSMAATIVLTLVSLIR
jgi:hypothetical protein